MRRKCLAVLAVVATVSVTACASRSPGYPVVADSIPEPLVAGGGDPVEGRRIFVDRKAGHCVLCHRVAGLDAPFQGDLGPSLSSVGARLSSGQIRLRIVDASRVNPDTVMPPYYRSKDLEQVAPAYRGQTALSASEVEHLVAWLATLRREGEDA